MTPPKTFPACHEDKYGVCAWELCPQVRDDEPGASGRRCPLEAWELQPTIPPRLQEVLDEEILLLFDDLHEARKVALDGDWSMKCGWLVERIAALHSVGGNLTELRATAMTAAFHAEVVSRVGEKP